MLSNRIITQTSSEVSNIFWGSSTKDIVLRNAKGAQPINNPEREREMRRRRRRRRKTSLPSTKCSIKQNLHKRELY